MHPMIVWILVFTGPNPYPAGTYATHGACIQAQYNLGRDQVRQTSTGSRPNPFKCRPQIELNN